MEMSFENKQGFSVRSNVYDTNVQSHGEMCLGYRGFKIGFSNGYSISVQFGTVNYCDAYQSNTGKTEQEQGEWLESVCPNAEIAILAPDGKFVPFKDGHDVRGHTPPDSLAEIIAWVVKQPPKNPN